MHSVVEALEIALREATPAIGIEVVAIRCAAGRVLAQDVAGDRDLPPFAKAMMDGVAVRAADARAGSQLRVVEEITAGRMPSRTVGPGEAARIMTGAPMPQGADGVVMVEDCRFDGDSVTVGRDASPGQHVQPRGREIARGERVLTPGIVLGPAAVGLLAAVGRASVEVFKRPRVAVLTTGDELVDASSEPGLGQIRNSNGPMLAALLGDRAVPLGNARDDREELRAKIAAGLEADVLVMSGGVSAGKLDLVPDSLREAGVSPLIHKVNMKPGKPLFFGTRGRTMVFGLPGNPGATFVGFHLFVRPALSKLEGRVACEEAVVLPLAAPLHHRGDRPTYRPARIELGEVGETVRVLSWLGSPDLKALAVANALAVLDAGDQTLPTGEPVPVIRLPA